MLPKRDRSPTANNGSGRIPNKRTRQNDAANGRFDTRAVGSANSDHAELQIRTGQTLRSTTNGCNAYEAASPSPPSSACASHGSFNSVTNGLSSNRMSLPSLDSDNKSTSDQSWSSRTDSGSEYCQSLGHEHAAFPPNFITRSGQIPLNEAGLALASLTSPDDSHETMSYGLDRFLNTEDDPWTQYSAARAKQADELIEV